MQRRGCGAAFLAGLKGDLRVHYFEEEVLLTFGEDFDLRLVGELREHPSALARERQGHARHKLVDAGVAVEDLGVELALRVRDEWISASVGACARIAMAVRRRYKQRFIIDSPDYLIRRSGGRGVPRRDG